MENNLKFIANTRNGKPVYDRFNSHWHEDHLPKELLIQAIEKVNAVENWKKAIIDFEREVGMNICLETTDEDECFYAIRNGRNGKTRFVMGREKEPCSTVVLILKKDLKKDYYVLITAFVGIDPEPEPWDRNATEKSIEFWKNHAISFDGKEEKIKRVE